MTATEICSPATWRQSILAWLYAPRSAACAWARRTTCGPAISAAPAAIAALSARRRPGRSILLLDSSLMTFLLVLHPFSTNRRERAAPGRVVGTLGLE